MANCIDGVGALPDCIALLHVLQLKNYRRLKLKLALEESGFMAERLGSCNSLTAGVPLLERNAMVLNAAGMGTAAKIEDLCLQ